MAITKREIVSFVIGGLFVATSIFVSHDRHAVRPAEIAPPERPKCSFADVIPEVGYARDYIEATFINACFAKIDNEMMNMPKEGQTSVTYVFGHHRACGRGWIKIEATYEDGKLIGPVKTGEMSLTCF